MALGWTKVVPEDPEGEGPEDFGGYGPVQASCKNGVLKTPMNDMGAAALHGILPEPAGY